mgnify:CR=1 FL=1
MGSGFRVQGSGLSWRLCRILDDGILVSSAFPSRGRCPEGADRAQAARKRAGKSVSSTSFVRVPERRSASIYIKRDARLRIILAPSSGRGRRAKRVGVGILARENTASRSQPPPLRGTSFQRKEGVCRLPASSFRAKARNLFRLRSRKDVRRGITGNTVLPTTSSRFESQPLPLWGTSFQRKEGEKWNEE